MMEVRIKECVFTAMVEVRNRILKEIQLNPAVAYFKGQVKIMLYFKVLSIANIQMITKTLLWTKVCMRYWRNYGKSGCAIAGFHCS